MPINVEAKLLHRSVFFTGETVHCQVSFTYVDPSEISNLKSADPVTRVLEHNHVDLNATNSTLDDLTIAWASAQIYCQCHINESRVVSINNIKEHNNLPADVMTSFIPTRGETGHCFLSTKPVILMCNMKLKKGQTKIVNYSDDIPENAPPSYKGQAVRFTYKITIGVGSIHGPTKLIRLPIRVMSTEGLAIENQNPHVPCESLNPFLDDIVEEDHSLSDILVDRLTYLTSQRNNNVYNISCSQGCAGKFSLSKSYYRIGEDLQGSFDFTDAVVRCMKYKVSLQSEEEVLEGFRNPTSKQKTLHTTYSRCEECCLNCRQTNFCLPIPITATPEFTSKVVAVRWRLHCEVTTAAHDESVGTAGQKEEDTKNRRLGNGLRHGLQNCNVPKNVKIETMTWDVPVRIVASNPNQISLTSSNQLSASVIL